VVAGLPGLDLGAPELTDAGVQNLFQLLPSGGVGENPACKLIPAQTTVGGKNRRTEELANFGQRGLLGPNNDTGQVVGVDNGKIASTEELNAGGLAHAETTGQPNGFHRKLSEFEIADIMPGQHR